MLLVSTMYLNLFCAQRDANEKSPDMLMESILWVANFVIRNTQNNLMARYKNNNILLRISIEKTTKSRSFDSPLFRNDLNTQCWLVSGRNYCNFCPRLVICKSSLEARDTSLTRFEYWLIRCFDFSIVMWWCLATGGLWLKLSTTSKWRQRLLDIKTIFLSMLKLTKVFIKL